MVTNLNLIIANSIRRTNSPHGVLPRSVFAVYPTIEENIPSGELPITKGITRLYIRG